MARAASVTLTTFLMGPMSLGSRSAKHLYSNAFEYILMIEWILNAQSQHIIYIKKLTSWKAPDSYVSPQSGSLYLECLIPTHILPPL